MDKLIRQRDALDAVTKYCTMYDLRELLSDIDSLPSAEQERKTGKWLDAYYSYSDGCRVWYRICTACGYERDDDNPDKDTKYCPECGAKMET